MNCPICARLIICKVFPKKKQCIDIHCVCGYNWKGFAASSPKLAEEDMVHEFYGDWQDEEVRRVLRAINMYCDNDLRFWKGKKIITSWADAGVKQGKLDRVLVFKTVDELVKAI